MATPRVLNEMSLYRFLEEYGDNRVKRELVFFWGCHPNAKFARNAIYYALDCAKLEMDRGLKALVEAGLVDAHLLNGVTFYSLTENEERRRPVLELASLDWNQWHLIAKQIEQEREVASFVSRHKFDVNSKWRET